MDDHAQDRARHRADTLQAVADEKVRQAQLQLAARMRILAAAAMDVALELELAGPHDRITSHVPAKYDATRDAIAHLQAVREGATKLRQEASRIVQQRSA